MTVGHSLCELLVLVAAGALFFEKGLRLVYARAMTMQKACDAVSSTMAAIIVLPDETMEQICIEISTVNNVVVPVNYNCLGRVVISGNMDVIKEACTKLKGAKAYFTSCC